jgi:hypothetical protein
VVEFEQLASDLVRYQILIVWAILGSNQ